MIVIILICIAVIGVFVIYSITLNRSDIEEGTASISLPFKIELKFKKKTDKAKDITIDGCIDKSTEKSPTKNT